MTIFIFPVADGTVKTPGGDRSLRTSTLTRERPERGEEQEILQRKSDELQSPTSLQDDSTRDDAEAEKDFWSITGEFIYRHHVVHRGKLYMPREESFPIPLKYIDVTRTTCTSLDVLLEKNIEDYWNVDGEKELSETWTQFTRFVLLKEWPPEGYTWSRVDLQGNNKLLVLTMCGQICGSLSLMQRKRKQNKDGLSRNQNSKTPHS